MNDITKAKITSYFLWYFLALFVNQTKTKEFSYQAVGNQEPVLSRSNI